MEEKENLNVRQGRETKLDNREKRFGEIRDKNERGRKRENTREREREEGEIEGGRERKAVEIRIGLSIGNPNGRRSRRHDGKGITTEEKGNKLSII